MKVKNVIIVLLIIIVVFILLALIGYGMMNNPIEDKTPTVLNITSNSTLYEFNNISLLLTDVDGRPLEGKNVSISVLSEDGSNDYYTIITNSTGGGTVRIEKGLGMYTVNCTYAGDDSYTAARAFQRLQIVEEVIQPTQYNYTYNQTGNSSYYGYNNNYNYYDSNANGYYDNNYKYDYSNQYQQRYNTNLTA